ncbi:hypothetical protein DF186_11985 [Enterococcus hirae]|uniref:hypothetical protein n=1 Tax=Enterococcus hirae TaxID=1354 RepID=UPI000BA0ED9D|nr:hypothetical protein [Enterococcus hirae]OZS39950.1 hypothetical protein CHB54_08855 [Enterococcus hirae]OZS41090.1 hypothetical protein CHB54_00570 [Enterococcus hirae]PWG75539.1 hypothetical protein DF186_11985 [Enterococcus hirae]
MKWIKLLLFNLSCLTAVYLYCGLLCSQLSILPSYQPYLMRMLNIPAASMPLDIMGKLIRNLLFTTINLIVVIGISLVIYKKEGMRR